MSKVKRNASEFSCPILRYTGLESKTVHDIRFESILEFLKKEIKNKKKSEYNNLHAMRGS